MPFHFSVWDKVVTRDDNEKLVYQVYKNMGSRLRL